MKLTLEHPKLYPTLVKSPMYQVGIDFVGPIHPTMYMYMYICRSSGKNGTYTCLIMHANEWAGHQKTYVMRVPSPQLYFAYVIHNKATMN